jgi:hypothetical protein
LFHQQQKEDEERRKVDWIMDGKVETIKLVRARMDSVRDSAPGAKLDWSLHHQIVSFSCV